MLECVLNLSEGRDQAHLDAFRTAVAGLLLDIHSDADLNRSVLTLAGEADALHEGVAAVTRLAVSTLDLSAHVGAHPRLGVVDVVPFVDLADPAAPATPRSLGARDRFADWAATELGLPCFLYGPERSLPEVRREAWTALLPDRGPRHAHPTAGAVCVGARGALIAYNVLLASDDVAIARRIAARARRPGLRALGFSTGHRAMVSCNLTEPYHLGPADAYDTIAGIASQTEGTAVADAELVGLLPAAVLATIPRYRCAQLGIRPDRTIESALGAVAG